MQILRLGLRALATGLMVAGLTSAANAADLEAVEEVVEEAAPKDSIFTRGNLLGDPFGIRKKVADHGLNLVALYVNQAVGNPTGGTSSQVGYSDLFFFIFDYDLEKSPLNLKGGQISWTITNRNGNNVGGDAAIGTNLLINEVFGQGNIWRLNHLWYQQSLFDNKVTVKLGRISGSFDFFDFRCNFQNLIFCGAVPAYISHNYTPFPGHQWGAIGTFRPIDDLYIKIGVTEINPDNNLQSNGFQFNAPGGGDLGIRNNFEIGYDTDFKGNKGLWRAGFFFDNIGADLNPVNNGGPAGGVVPGLNNVVFGVPAGDVTELNAIPLGGAGNIFGTSVGAALAGNGGADGSFGLQSDDDQFGWYILLEQDVWRGENGRGIRLFGSYVKGDSDIVALEQVAQIGLFFQGPLPSRPLDELGWAFGGIFTNDLVTDFLEANGLPVSNNEYTTEIYYSARVLPSVIIQPNFQYIFNPAGFSELPDVAALGVKTVVFF